MRHVLLLLLLERLLLAFFLRRCCSGSGGCYWFCHVVSSQFLVRSLCLSCGLLLVRDRALARTLAGTRVGVGALSADRQITAVTRATVRADLDETLDVHGDVFAKIAFH